MASILKVDEIKGNSTAGIIAVTGEGNSTTTNLQQGLAKAWANFDGDASGIGIRDSFNVASNTDNGTGDYTITFTNSMANVGYCIAGAGEAGGGGSPMCLAVNGTDGLLTGSARMYTKTASPADSNVVSVMAQGDLA